MTSSALQCNVSNDTLSQWFQNQYNDDCLLSAISPGYSSIYCSLNPLYLTVTSPLLPSIRSLGTGYMWGGCADDSVYHRHEEPSQAPHRCPYRPLDEVASIAA